MDYIKTLPLPFSTAPAAAGQRRMHGGYEMKYLSVTETAERWGISTRRIQILCNEDRIPGAIRIGRTWAIPDDEPKPADARIKSGRYIKISTENEKQAAFLYQHRLQ